LTATAFLPEFVSALLNLCLHPQVFFQGERMTVASALWRATAQLAPSPAAVRNSAIFAGVKKPGRSNRPACDLKMCAHLFSLTNRTLTHDERKIKISAGAIRHDRASSKVIIFPIFLALAARFL
jgi:hypothetical protein